MVTLSTHTVSVHYLLHTSMLTQRPPTTCKLKCKGKKVWFVQIAKRSNLDIASGTIAVTSPTWRMRRLVEWAYAPPVRSSTLWHRFRHLDLFPIQRREITHRRNLSDEVALSLAVKRMYTSPALPCLSVTLPVVSGRRLPPPLLCLVSHHHQ
jgi:hypothetical protein